MSTNSLILKPQTTTTREFFLKGLALLLILLFSSGAFAINPGFGIGLFFLALLIFILFGANKLQGRNLLLLLYANLLVITIVSTVSYRILVFHPEIRQLAQSNPMANVFLGTYAATALVSILMGILVASLLVTIPFLLVVAATATIILKWHKREEISFVEAFFYVLRAILGISPFLITIENGDIKGTEEDKRWLEIFGGPGWLIVHPGQVVALHYRGKITRIVGAGSVMLDREEKVKAVLPLDSQTKSQPIEYVLTQDRIPLRVVVAHSVQVEPAAETKARLQQAVKAAEKHLHITIQKKASPTEIRAAESLLQEAKQKRDALKNDRLVGDESDQCYESIAKLVAIRAPDVWKALSIPVAVNLRDVIMSEGSENLFDISQDEADLEARINQRKIAEIEKIVYEKAKKMKIDQGVVLKFVDIHEVHFPEKIKAKIEEEAKRLIEERIQHTDARIEESKAKALIINARAKAQARILEGQGEGEAQAALFREILRELKREQIEEGKIADALLDLISSSTSIKELQSFYKATRLSAYQRQVSLVQEEANSDH